MSDQTEAATMHGCCGCSCWVCERNHQAGPHTDECARRWQWGGVVTATTECGFCKDGGVVFSSRREALGLPPEVECPYCDGTGKAPQNGREDDDVR